MRMIPQDSVEKGDPDAETSIASGTVVKICKSI